jgi:hypothetical protein
MKEVEVTTIVRAMAGRSTLAADTTASNQGKTALAQ